MKIAFKSIIKDFNLKSLKSLDKGATMKLEFEATDDIYKELVTFKADEVYYITILDNIDTNKE